MKRLAVAALLLLSPSAFAEGPSQFDLERLHPGRPKTPYKSAGEAIAEISPEGEKARALKEASLQRAMMSRVPRIDFRGQDAVEYLVSHRADALPKVLAAFEREVFRESTEKMERVRSGAFWSLGRVLSRAGTPEARASLARVAALKQGEPGADFAEQAKFLLDELDEEARKLAPHEQKLEEKKPASTKPAPSVGM